MRFVDQRLTGIFLIVLTLIVFGPFIAHAFVSLDDNYLIYANPAVQTLSLRNILHVFSTYDPQLYIPLTFLSWQLNAALFGMNATAFHLVNVLMHCANVVLVLVIIRRLSGNLFVAALTAALFAIHPLQTEAVLWAAGRKDLLSGFFALLSLLQYLKFREHRNSRTFMICIICFALALLSKISVVLLPAIFLLIDWLTDRKIGLKELREKIPFGVLSAIFLVIAVIGKSRLLAQSGGIVNLLLPFRSTTFYLWKIFSPAGLSVIYLYEPGSSLFADFAGPVIIVLLLGLLTLFLIARRAAHPALALGMFFLLLAPSYSTFLKNGFLYFASDRYVYLALIGAFWFLTQLLDAVRKRLPGKATLVIPVLSALVILTLIPSTYAQNAVWKDTESLYRNVLRWYPNSVMAHTNLGLELQNRKNLQGARVHYEKAMQSDPHSVHAYFNLASLENEEGHPEAAEKLYVAIVDAFGPQQVTSVADVRPFLWLIGKLNRLGRAQDAERLFNTLQELAPEYLELAAREQQQ